MISVLNTSDPTMGQKGTFEPSSCAMASAMAVFPGEQMIQLRSPYAMSIDSSLSITSLIIDLEFGFRMSRLDRTCAWRARHEDRPARHPLRPDEIHDNARRLPRLLRD